MVTAEVDWLVVKEIHSRQQAVFIAAGDTESQLDFEGLPQACCHN